MLSTIYIPVCQFASGPRYPAIPHMAARPSSSRYHQAASGDAPSIEALVQEAVQPLDVVSQQTLEMMPEGGGDLRRPRIYCPRGQGAETVLEGARQERRDPKGGGRV